MAQTARSRRAQVPRGPIPIFPEELVVWEILVRVPAKTLLRCRAVCRSWCRLTSGSDFLLAHHRHQPPLPLVSFRDRADRFTSTLDALDLWRSPAERLPVLRINRFDNCNPGKVHASCDGLVVVSLSLNRYYYICNPATRQWISLPGLTGHSVVAGLYPHSSSGEYRILYWNRWVIDGNALCYVLTVGSSVAPRGVGKSLEIGLHHVTKDQPVLLHDCLHWVHRRMEKVLVFDTVGESFRWMNAPTVKINARTDDSKWTESHLVQINGTLAISHINWSGTIMKLWMLQNYEAEVWLMKYQIELPVVEMSNIANTSNFNGMVLSENGDVLVYCDQGSNLFQCDSTGKLLQKFQWDGVFSRPARQWFTESLVQHAFFHTEDGRPARNPRLFEGL